MLQLVAAVETHKLKEKAYRKLLPPIGISKGDFMKEIIVTVVAIVVAAALALLLIGKDNDSSMINVTKGLFETQVESLSDE